MHFMSFILLIIIMTGDHIKPKSIYRDQEETIDALQTLCLPCKAGKGCVDEKDLRAA
jgi:hypothetical protein